jgi:hypothetical protein
MAKDKGKKSKDKAPAKKSKKGKEEELEVDTKKGGKGKKGKGSTVVDFSKEVEHEGGGGRWLKRVAEGDYRFKVQSIEETRARSGSKMLVVIFKGNSPGVSGQQLRDRFVLVPNSLFRLRQFLEAAGQSVPKRGVTINHKELIGVEVGITLRDGDEYEGKIRSEAGDYMPAEDVLINEDTGRSKKSKDKGGKKSKKGKKGKGDDLEDLDLDGM